MPGLFQCQGRAISKHELLILTWQIPPHETDTQRCWGECARWLSYVPSQADRIFKEYEAQNIILSLPLLKLDGIALHLSRDMAWLYWLCSRWESLKYSVIWIRFKTLFIFLHDCRHAGSLCLSVNDIKITCQKRFWNARASEIFNFQIMIPFLDTLSSYIIKYE